MTKISPRLCIYIKSWHFYLNFSQSFFFWRGAVSLFQKVFSFSHRSVWVIQETSVILEQRNLDLPMQISTTRSWLGQFTCSQQQRKTSTVSQMMGLHQISSAVQRCFIQISRRSSDTEYSKAWHPSIVFLSLQNALWLISFIQHLFTFSF